MKLASYKKYVTTPISIPEGRVGQYSIKHTPIKPGAQLESTNMRFAYYGEPIPYFKIDYPDGGMIHSLLKDRGSVLMTDNPIELLGQAPFIHKAKGDVLIGCLGLGVVAEFLANKKTVKNITVVERSDEIIKLVQPHINPRINIVHADLFDYLEKVERLSWSSAWFDIWSPTSEWVWSRYILPLRVIVGRRFGYQAQLKVSCWAESLMLNQLLESYERMADIPAERLKNEPAYWIWRKGIERFKTVPEDRLTNLSLKSSSDIVKKLEASGGEPYEGLKEDMSPLDMLMHIKQSNKDNRDLQGATRVFFSGMGLDIWEQMFGKYYDEYVQMRPHKVRGDEEHELEDV